MFFQVSRTPGTLPRVPLARCLPRPILLKRSFINIDKGMGTTERYWQFTDWLTVRAKHGVNQTMGLQTQNGVVPPGWGLMDDDFWSRQGHDE